MLVDSRFAEPRFRSPLPRWLRGSLLAPGAAPHFGAVAELLRPFFSRLLADPPVAHGGGGEEEEKREEDGEVHKASGDEIVDLDDGDEDDGGCEDASRSAAAPKLASLWRVPRAKRALEVAAAKKKAASAAAKQQQQQLKQQQGQPKLHEKLAAVDAYLPPPRKRPALGDGGREPRQQHQQLEQQAHSRQQQAPAAAAAATAAFLASARSRPVIGRCVPLGSSTVSTVSMPFEVSACVVVSAVVVAFGAVLVFLGAACFLVTPDARLRFFVVAIAKSSSDSLIA